MYKRVFKYTDYNGVDREEEVFFNLTESEIAELSLSEEGGFDAMIKRITQAQDGRKIVETFKKILLLSYGEKSPDGRRFIKSPEISSAFAQTPMYNELFMELAFDSKKASEFINMVAPRPKGDGGKLKNFTPGPIEPTNVIDVTPVTDNASENA